jgi:hypothetical protein
MMLSRAKYEEVLEMRREVTALRADFAQTVHDYYSRKAGFRSNQPRWPEGTPGTPKPGGRWSGGPGTGAPVDGTNPAGRNPGGHHFVPRVIFGKKT